MEDKEACTLVVRHLPADLTPTEKQDLLCHFGATHIRVMGTKGPMKHMAFAKFNGHKAAKLALSRMHQLEIMGHRLVAEFAMVSHDKYWPSELYERAVQDVKKREKEDKTEKNKEQKKPHPSLSVEETLKKWGFEYPQNPNLTYLYPPPTVNILTNIANALASYPKFYVQVLHLMNKMNLPAPFGPVTTTPPIATELDEMLRAPDHIQTEEMEYSSSEESEIGSDTDIQRSAKEVPLPKRKTRHKSMVPRKVLRLIQPPDISKCPVEPVLKPEEVFEGTTAPVHRKIQLKVPLVTHNEQESQTFRDKDNAAEKMSENVQIESIGFGKMEPIEKPHVEDTAQVTDISYKVDPKQFVSREDLKKGRVIDKEMKNFSVFKNYEPGEATSRLYIKNLNKKTTEQDLVNVFGSYVDWNKETDTMMFDIRLMKEGRMKGQAFITLPSEDAARKALRDTNCFVLNSKPMVVQFARSAKAKDPVEKKT
ncbi:hypothetical protein CHS0354_028526 [Potamilus streckersoni]|uniref:RNA-binding region-containing protein 3 n=1 Tax=Potamilus streckersoni TaxID=2493646 RepID=A0AAE0RN11_9BIVA|nr:hypothetical protein CHS0354_028526 [Potamilus streckersoni]